MATMSNFTPVFVIALGLGIFLAFALDALDPVMRDRRALDRLGLPTLAHIPRP